MRYTADSPTPQIEWHLLDGAGTGAAVLKGSTTQLDEAEIRLTGTDAIGTLDLDLNGAAPPSGSLATAETEERKSFELKDHLGNIRSLTAGVRLFDPTRRLSTAGLSDMKEYYPFGMVARSYGPQGYRWGYNAMELDANTGDRYDYGARLYDPAVSRWLSIDPSADKYPALSLYIYSLNNPILFKDPDGKDPFSAIVEGIIAFGIEAGLSYMTSYMIEGLSPEESFAQINWKAAAFEGVTATAFAAFMPPGGQTAVKLGKLATNKAGKATVKLVQALVTEASKAYISGDFNDKDGNFDTDVMQSKLREILVAAVLDASGAKVDFKSNKLVEKMVKSKQKLDQAHAKLHNIQKSAGASQKRIQKRVDAVNKAAKELGNNVAKVAAVKTAETAGQKVLNSGSNEAVEAITTKK